MYVDYCGDDRSCEIREFIDERFCKDISLSKQKNGLMNSMIMLNSLVVFTPLLVNIAMRSVILISNACIIMIELLPNTMKMMA